MELFPGEYDALVGEGVLRSNNQFLGGLVGRKATGGNGIHIGSVNAGPAKGHGVETQAELAVVGGRDSGEDRLDVRGAQVLECVGLDDVHVVLHDNAHELGRHAREGVEHGELQILRDPLGGGVAVSLGVGMAGVEAKRAAAARTERRNNWGGVGEVVGVIRVRL